MTNFEKYKNEILGITTESHSNIAVKDGVIVACTGLDCSQCDFLDGVVSCSENRFKWLYEDDSEDRDCCDGCKYEYKREDESPCTECCNNYTSKFERRLEPTRQDEFLELYPNVRKCHGVIDICPKDLDVHFYCRAQESLSGECTTCCQDYWFQEVEE